MKLITGRGHDWTTKLPHVASAAGKVRTKQALLDGKVAVLLPSGKSTFHGLQEALSGSEEGKMIQPSALAPDSLVRYSDHVLGQGPEFFANAKRLGLEGVVSKRRSAPYRPGRTTDWLKSKAVHRQEFVVQAAYRDAQITSRCRRWARAFA